MKTLEEIFEWSKEDWLKNKETLQETVDLAQECVAHKIARKRLVNRVPKELWTKEVLGKKNGLSECVLYTIVEQGQLKEINPDALDIDLLLSTVAVGEAVIHAIARSEDIGLVKGDLLIPEIVCKTNKVQETPLHIAVKNNTLQYIKLKDENCVECFLKENSKGVSVIEEAVRAGLEKDLRVGNWPLTEILYHRNELDKICGRCEANAVRTKLEDIKQKKKLKKENKSFEKVIELDDFREKLKKIFRK